MSNESSISDLQISVSSNTDNITSNTNSITSNISSITNLQTSVTTNYDNISSNTNSITSILSSISSLEEGSINPSVSTLTASGTITAETFNATSDRNLKKNIKVIKNSLSIIENIDGVEFIFKNNNFKNYGVIAQDIEKILPFIVNTNNDGIKSVNYNNFIGLLIEGLKELNNKNNELELKLEKVIKHFGLMHI